MRRISEDFRKNTSNLLSVLLKAVFILALIVALGACSGGKDETTPTYTVGGTVSGLIGSGFVLLNNSGDDLSVSANGTFTFATKLTNGKDYAVTIGAYPDNPLQTCTVTNGSGTISGASVTNVEITCTSIYTVGGTVSGLTGSGLVLKNNGGDDLSIAADGSFTFASKIADGNTYAVTVGTQPSGQTCVLTNPSGTISGANVTNVAVQCGTPGSLDATFGTGGIITTSIGTSNDWGEDIAMQTDGKIVVAGSTFGIGSNSDFAVARYNTDGSLDTTFGTGGIVTTSISIGDKANAVAIQSDGKIVAAGYSNNGSLTSFALIRYNANGSLDTTFGTGGIVTNTIVSGYSNASGIAVQADGKIVLAGSCNDGSKLDFAVARYTANGSLDTTFGTNGVVATSVGSTSDIANSVAIQPDGKIILAGASSNSSYNSDFALVRYTADGLLDTTFGTGGVVVTAIVSGNDTPYTVAVLTDGKIIAAGYSYNGSNEDFALVRYIAGGSLDTTFGTGGIVTTAIGTGNDTVSGLAIQADGKIVTAGTSYNGTKSYFALARYNTGGTLDSTFGTGGIVTTAIGTKVDSVHSVAIQADGRIVAAGVSSNGSNFDIAVVRYWP